ncbi:hypothetical protein VHEMI01673 [[Torrubiella] hemipterigena]|uniref:NACHT domain-containing protein n=1 Tax=[Torrubiella] hemipterigena TaxID=1531966 RepID=A0A0A1T5H7_9HYPO|nr:hypothetical protein VHEMI01673 [[Torrubiella] hemipterigena]
MDGVQQTTLDTKCTVQRLVSDAHSDKIARWLSAPVPSANQNKARELHQPGTGQWFLDSEHYQSWKKVRGSFLWLYGKSGCGKTILSSTVVADLDNDTTTSPNLLYFYFDFNDVGKTSTEQAVRSLIDQLYRKGVRSRRLLDSFYAQHARSGEQLSQALLQKLLQNMIVQCRDVWIVLDGLDECNTRGLHTSDSVLLWIKKLSSPPSNLHVLVTSRPENDIKSSIEAWASTDEIVSLQPDLFADDIGIYIHTRVKQLDRWRGSPDIQKLVASTLNERADGMFRWAACQLDSLEHCLSLKDITRELAALPRTLDETYARMYYRISPEFKPVAIRLLQLLTHSKRPLRIEEAVDAIAVEPGSKPRFDPRNRMPFPTEITQYCLSFVSLTYKYAPIMKAQVIEIQLAHFSVQEYLQSDRLEPALGEQLNKAAAATAIVDLCVSYLLSLNVSLPLHQTKEQYPFAEFSAQYWSDFALIMEESNQKVPDILKEYYSSQQAFASGYDLYSPDKYQRTTNADAVSPLYYASFTGLLRSVLVLLETDVDLNAGGGWHGNALQAASIEGHKAIVQSLLKSGAEVNTQGGCYGNALQAASIIF